MAVSVLLFAAVIIGFGWLVSRCGSSSASSVVVTAVPPELTGSTVSPRRIDLDVRGAVAGAGYEAVTVREDGGVIVLEGVVATEQDRERAERAARSLADVDDVDNRLTLEETDDDIEAAVSSAIADGGHRRVSVAVNAGVAVLSGAADSEEQRDDVVAIAMAVDGVVEVEDELVITADAGADTPEAISLVADLAALFETDPILFEPASSVITEESQLGLDAAVELIVSGPAIILEIAGHTDSAGDETENQLLSEARAESVKAYLVAKGADPDLLQATGYGEGEPIESNDTEAGRTANRRIEFRAISTAGEPSDPQAEEPSE